MSELDANPGSAFMINSREATDFGSLIEVIRDSWLECRCVHDPACAAAGRISGAAASRLGR